MAASRSRRSPEIWPLFGLYGFYGAATEGVSKALVADCRPTRAAGRPWGMHTVTGLFALRPAWLPDSMEQVGSAAPFLYGAGCALAAAAALLFLSARRSTGTSAR